MSELDKIVNRAIKCGFITEADRIWAFNTLLRDPRIEALVPPPREVIAKFNALYAENPISATDWFYKFSTDSNYIQLEAAEKNIAWEHKSRYGALNITINLAKPEKDPKDIAKAAADTDAPSYPRCLLCRENEGYHAGTAVPDSLFRVPRQADRTSHRIIPLDLSGRGFYFQYSPYVYYNEHCIVLDAEHIPMKISRETLVNLFAFLKQFPHYFIGSNADLPIVGGSILAHEHYQGGNAVFPIDGAKTVREVKIPGFASVHAEILDWPLSVARLTSGDAEELINAGYALFDKWRRYSNPALGIIAETNGTPHNTITPIARKRGNNYVLNIAFRCNITSAEHPDGVFHAHSEFHHIKKEGIGLIEVMGLAILPPRLTDVYDTGKESDREYIGSVFTKVLENCGVFGSEYDAFAAFLEE